MHGRRHSLVDSYQLLDAVVITSRRESFSRVAAEALLAGVPLIAPDLDGLRETVAGESVATLFRPEDVADAACRLREVLGDPEAALDRARAGQQYAARFRPAASAARVLGIYRGLTSKLP